jgi:hypothetical protein
MTWQKVGPAHEIIFSGETLFTVRRTGLGPNRWWARQEGPDMECVLGRFHNRAAAKAAVEKHLDPLIQLALVQGRD